MSGPRPGTSAAVRSLRSWETALAWIGMVAGLLGGIIWGVIAIISWNRYKNGATDYPAGAVTIGALWLFGLAIVLLSR